MSIVKANITDLITVRTITRDTINAIYPHYYPVGAVDYFLCHHNDERIIRDIESGRVYLYLNDEGIATGTVTISENEICRLFVSEQYQGKGYGGALIDFAEKAIAEKHEQIILDASLPAKAIYLKRGYITTEYHVIKTENGDRLCYDEMTKSCL